MSPDLDQVRAARAALATHHGPDSAELRALLAQHQPLDAAAMLANANVPIASQSTGPARFHAGQPGDPGTGWRIVIPEDEEWPTGLADLVQTARQPEIPGVRAALCLWVLGEHPLGETLAASVAVAGSRAASPYGERIARELGRDLAEQHWTVVAFSGYGIASAALNGALRFPGRAAAVLPCGLDVVTPSALESQLQVVAREGLLVSAYPPGTRPDRSRVFATAQLVAALTRGSVLVEAAHRSTPLLTLEHTLRLGRTAMAVPGPVTSPTSAGCHAALRAYPLARLVTSTADVLAELPPPHRATFDVTVSRTETLTFRIAATDRTDAVNRYLADGDEISAETSPMEIDAIEEIGSPDRNRDEPDPS